MARRAWVASRVGCCRRPHRRARRRCGVRGRGGAGDQHGIPPPVDAAPTPAAQPAAATRRDRPGRAQGAPHQCECSECGLLPRGRSRRRDRVGGAGVDTDRRRSDGVLPRQPSDDQAAGLPAGAASAARAGGSADRRSSPARRRLLARQPHHLGHCWCGDDDLPARARSPGRVLPRAADRVVRPHSHDRGAARRRDRHTDRAVEVTAGGDCGSSVHAAVPGPRGLPDLAAHHAQDG